MATETELNRRLTEVNDAITALLSGAPVDHKTGELSVNKSAMYKALTEERRQLESALQSVPAIKTRQTDTIVSRFGQESTRYRGDTTE